MSGTVAGRRVLVTGASGFVGRHIVNSLSDSGFDILAQVNKTPLDPSHAEKCEVVRGDICEPEIRRSAVRGVDVVCHSAAYIPEDMADPGNARKCHRINALATLSLVREAAEAGVGRFVFLSTGNMYELASDPARETDPFNPDLMSTAYFASKLAAEQYVEQIGIETGVDALVLRVTTPYGPGEPSAKVIPAFLKRAAGGEPLRVLGGGRQQLNFVYVEDVADCVANAVGSGESGTYNVCSGEGTDLLSLARTVSEICSADVSSIEVETQKETVARRAGFQPVSIEKARQTWGFNPITLTDGLRRYRSYLSEQEVAV